MNDPMRMLGDNPIQQLKDWVKQYEEDEQPSQGQCAAVAAMWFLLNEIETGELDILEAEGQARRCAEIINAFLGKLAILNYLNSDIGDDD